MSLTSQCYLFQEPYVNQSAVSIQQKFSLHRTYIVFRTLGLRHLTVVDNENRVVGVITRKDLMGFNMEEKLGAIMNNSLLMQEPATPDTVEERNFPA